MLQRGGGGGRKAHKLSISYIFIVFSVLGRGGGGCAKSWLTFSFQVFVLFFFGGGGGGLPVLKKSKRFEVVKSVLISTKFTKL